MLRAGASLLEVGQVLRHRDLTTTAIYANYVALRIVLPEPDSEIGHGRQSNIIRRCFVGSCWDGSTLQEDIMSVTEPDLDATVAFLDRL